VSQLEPPVYACNEICYYAYKTVAPHKFDAKHSSVV